jgi:3-(3-hydroxy-phenyl)propionate hydroxylase
MVGRMLPQPLVAGAAGPERLMDDLIGNHFGLVSLVADSSPPMHPLWRSLGARFIRVLSEDKRPVDHDSATVREVGAGRLAAIRKVYSGRTLLVRPDRYVAASFSPDEEHAVAGSFGDLIGANVELELATERP